MDFKFIIFLTGICLLVGCCQGAETPSYETTSTTSLATPTTSTISSTTTASPTTVPGVDFSSWACTASRAVPIPPQSKTWVVVDKTTNETCIVAQITSQFNFSYPVEIKANANITTGDTIIIVPLDNTTEATGLCTNTSQGITLKWKENSVEIDFQLDKDKNFFVNLNTFNLTGQQNCSGKETVLTYKSGATVFKTQVDMSYECDKVPAAIMTAVSGNSSAILSISHTKLQVHRPKKDNVTGPALVLRPMPPDINAESNLICIKPSDPQNIQFWTNQLDEFLEEYKTLSKSGNVVKCDYDHPPQPGKVCDVNIRELGQCTSDNKYNYNKGGLCIFLKLNKIYGWKPTGYDNPRNLPHNMPVAYRLLTTSLRQFKPALLNKVWVSCQGENPADKENVGPIHYLTGPVPDFGFPGYYFPYLNQEGYMSPFVAVHFERPATGVRINIVCKAWAQNIENGRPESPGSLHFSIMVDKELPTPPGQ